MDAQLYAALGCLAVALFYLGRRAWRTWTASGCGGCGCATKRTPTNGLIGVDELTARLRGRSR